MNVLSAHSGSRWQDEVPCHVGLSLGILRAGQLGLSEQEEPESVSKAECGVLQPTLGTDILLHLLYSVL